MIKVYVGRLFSKFRVHYFLYMILLLDHETEYGSDYVFGFWSGVSQIFSWLQVCFSRSCKVLVDMLFN